MTAPPYGAAMRLRLCTWNITSVRLRHEQVARFVAEQAPDVLCLQEIKCREGEFPREAFVEMGLPHLKIAGQKGWHGVAIASALAVGSPPPAASLPRGPRPLRRRDCRGRGDPQLLHSGR